MRFVTKVIQNTCEYCVNFGPLSTAETWAYYKESGRGPWDYQGIAAPLLWREVKRAGRDWERLVHPEEWKVQGDLIILYKYLKRGCREDGVRLFPVVSSDRARGKGHKPAYKKFHLNIRKHSFTMWVMEVVESPYVEIFKSFPGKSVIDVAAWVGGWTRWPAEIPSNHNNSVILSFHLRGANQFCM